MNDRPLIWRPAAEADAPQIARIERDLFGETAWSERVIIDEVTADHRRYTVVEAAGAVVAYGGVLVVGGDGDIQTIAVTAQMQGQGIGRALLERLIADGVALGATRVFLEVRADNPGAIGLYESQGFQHIGVRERYYQPGNVDARIMCLDLAGTHERGAQ